MTATSARPLLRSRTNREIAGVCGGLAEHYGADPSAVRLLAVVIAVLTAIVPMIVLYLVAAVLIPERGDEGVEPFAGPIVVRQGRASLVFGAILVGIGVLALANELFRVDWDVLWPIGLVALGGALLVAGRHRQEGISR